MLLLSGGGMAITVVAWRLITLVAERSADDPWPLAYGLYGTLGLVGLVLVSLGWTLGKTSVSGGVGPANFSLTGGESDGPTSLQVEGAVEITEKQS